MSALYEAIYNVVRTIPQGEVASYSQVARAIGRPRGARVVGWAMRALQPGTDVPWWRVINAQRVLSIINPRVSANEQKERLEKEGLVVTERPGEFVVQGGEWAELVSQVLPVER